MRLLFPALVLGALALGCRGPEDAARGTGRFSLPPDGSAKVLVTVIDAGPERHHVKWTVLGDRNWVQASATDGTLRLQQTYPLNVTDRAGGCHTWECDLTADATGWKAVVHGSNGVTAMQSGKTGGAFTARLTADTAVDVPANVVLADIGETKLTLILDR
jgi:hypothetical protein